MVFHPSFHYPTLSFHSFHHARFGISSESDASLESYVRGRDRDREPDVRYIDRD